MPEELPPVLLVHGFASSFDHGWRQGAWPDLLSDAGRTVIGLDLPGHGSSEPSHDPAHYGDVEDVVLAAIDGHDQVDAIGFSMGSRILLSLAAEHPERFRKLVVIGVGENLFRENGGSLSSMGTLPDVLERDEEPEDVFLRLFFRLAETTGNDRKALAAFLRGTRVTNSVDDLKRITVPTLVIVGDQDFVGSGQPLVDALPDARLVTLRNTDHFSAPQNFTCIDAALDFVDAGMT